MVLRSFLEDAIDFLENHDYEKLAWDLQDICNRIDKILYTFRKWKETKSDEILVELLNEIEALDREW